jgi:hypothetical protein
VKKNASPDCEKRAVAPAVGLAALRSVNSMEPARPNGARRRAAYDAALVERDKLAAELAEVYPALAAKLADLAARLAANDAAIEGVNQKLPNGGTWIASAELVARHLKSFFDGPTNIPRIAQHMRLPAFRYAPLEPYSWPPAK